MAGRSEKLSKRRDEEFDQMLKIVKHTKNREFLLNWLSRIPTKTGPS
jgi:hypothetical protein